VTELAPGTRLGRYELIERLGVGGMAEVWAARQRGIGGFERRVALKRILPRFAGDPRFVERFAAEAHLAESLSHAHIATIYGVEEVDGELVIAMELVRGETLGATIRRAWELTGAPVEPRLAAAIAARVCRALHHAHTLGDPAGRALGMVHRDVSPSNVLLGFRGEVKLVDFGIARALSDATAGLGGKPGYMSPEQARGAPVDARSDVFSAGVVLWEILTGMRLYGGLEAAATKAAICAPEAARSVLDARPGLPLVLAAVVERALHKDPADRYADAAAMASGLDACAYGLEGGPEQALTELMARLFKDRMERWSALLGDAPPPTASAPPPADTPYADAAGTDPDEGPPGAFPESLLARLDQLTPGSPEIAEPPALVAPPEPGAPTEVAATDPPKQTAPPIAEPPAPPVPPPLAELLRPPAGATLAPREEEAVSAPAPLSDQGPAAEDEAAETEPGAVLAVPARPAETPSRVETSCPIADGFEPDPFAEEDEDDERGPLVSFVATLDAAPPLELPEARPDEHQPLALEVIELAPGGGVADTRIVYRDKKREAATGSAANGALRITVRRRAATVETPARAHVVDGDALLPATGALVVGFAEPTTVEVDGVRYRLRVFVPPPRPPRALREILWGVYAVALIVVVGAHLSTAPLFSVLRDLGVTATVEPTEERFAEGQMEKPKPKPKPRPKPKPKVVTQKKRPPPVKREAPPPPETLEVVASVEQRPQVPKAVRQRLSQARASAQRSSTSAKDELMERLTAPKQGVAKSMEELKTNIDAKEAGRVSDVNRVTGAVAALPTETPGFARDGGAEHTGKLAGDTAEDIKKKLALAPKKKTGPVRGKVTGMKSGTRVSGQLDPGEVYRVIDANIAKILACYERRLQVTPSLAGRITFRWTVKENGGVTNVKQHVSTVPDPKVASCIKTVLSRLRFPKPEGGSVEISYPFIFRSN